MAKRVLSVPDKFKKFVKNLQIDNEIYKPQVKAIVQKVNQDFRISVLIVENAHFIGS